MSAWNKKYLVLLAHVSWELPYISLQNWCLENNVNNYQLKRKSNNNHLMNDKPKQPNQETIFVGHLGFPSKKYCMEYLQAVISFSLGQLESHWNSSWQPLPLNMQKILGYVKAVWN
jgi:hypothetical protein